MALRRRHRAATREGHDDGRDQKDEARVESGTEAVRATMTLATTTPSAWSKPDYAELLDRLAGPQETGSAGSARGRTDAVAALGPATGRPSRGAGGTLATAHSMPTFDETASGIPSATMGPLTWSCSHREAVPLTRLETVRELITELSPSEKVQALRWLAGLVSPSFPGIEHAAGVSGGEPCPLRTRIPVWLLVQARKLGSSESEILRAYPSLRAEDLSNAWVYYDVHGAEIDRQITENEASC